MLVRGPATPAATSPTANHITVSMPTFPLTASQIAALLHQPADYGPLADPRRRASCLNALGYPAGTPILGAQNVPMGDHAAVLLVLAGAAPQELIALVVQPSCSSVNAGLIADTRIARP